MECQTHKGKWHCDKRATHTMKVGYTIKRTGEKEFADLHLCDKHYLEVKNIIPPMYSH